MNQHSVAKSRLLISARDPAAAIAIRNYISSSFSAYFDILVIAQNTAIPYLEYSIEGQCCRFVAITSNDDKKMDEIARYEVRRFDPQFILVGNSGPGVGIDELLLELAVEYSIHSGLLQTFWGDLNPLLPVTPNIVFCIDSLAIEMTKHKTKAELIKIGDLQHYHYHDINFSDKRSLGRAGLELSGNDKLIIIMLQPGASIPGYYDSILEYCRSVCSLIGCDVKLIIKQHPKAERTDFELEDLIRDIFNDIDILSIPEALDYESLISSSDMLISAFSTCGIDLININRTLHYDVSTPVFVLQNNRLVEWLRSYYDFSNLLEIFKEGLVVLSKPDMQNSIEYLNSMDVDSSLNRNKQCEMPLDPCKLLSETIVGKIKINCSI